MSLTYNHRNASRRLARDVYNPADFSVLGTITSQNQGGSNYNRTEMLQINALNPCYNMPMHARTHSAICRCYFRKASRHRPHSHENKHKRMPEPPIVEA